VQPVSPNCQCGLRQEFLSHKRSDRYSCGRLWRDVYDRAPGEDRAVESRLIVRHENGICDSAETLQGLAHLA
jgi:hypothetical protein